MYPKIAIILVFSAVLLAGCTQTQTPSNNSNNNTPAANLTAAVTIQGYSFQPATLTVAAGTTVTWTNQDPVAHRIASDTFNSDSLSQGQTYSHTFSAPGTFDYHCSIHPSMTGTITVTG